MSAPNINDVAAGVPQQLFDAEIPQLALVVSALSGTASVATGSPNVTFSAAQTLNAGAILYFANQPGAPYTVSATTAASTSAVLTSNFTGYTNTATAVTTTAALAGTVSLTQGSQAVTFSTNQTITAGSLLTFSTQPSVYYVAGGVSAGTAMILLSPYRGPTNGVATTIAIAPLSGTVTLTASSTTVVFSAAQTLAAGTALEFSSQPGVYYSIAASITAQTSASLSTAYTGPTTGTLLTGNVTLTNNSASITFASAQTLPAGTILTFLEQPGFYYVLSIALSAGTAGVLTTVYTGTTDSLHGVTSNPCVTLAAVNDWLPTRGNQSAMANPAVPSGGFTPNAPTASFGGAARAIQCTVGGTAIVDTFGLNGQGTGNQFLPLVMTAGQQQQLSVTRIRQLGTTGSYMLLY